MSRAGSLIVKEDKRVWLQWMERRVYNELDAIRTPIGYVPRYEDLRELFREVLHRDYALDDYNKQFAIRVTKHLKRSTGYGEYILRSQLYLGGSSTYSRSKGRGYWRLGGYSVM